jgi:hypothetical protein
MIFLERKYFTIKIENEEKKYYAAVIPSNNQIGSPIINDDKLIIVLEIIDCNSDSPSIMYFSTLSGWIESFLGMDWLEEQILLTGVLEMTKEWEQY